VDARSGGPVAVDVWWLVDTGADLATVRNSVARGLLYRKVRGASASPTTGGGGILVVYGLDVEFRVVDRSRHRERVVVSSTQVGVKSNDAGSDVLGMRQLADQSATVEWSPRTGKGQIST